MIVLDSMAVPLDLVEKQPHRQMEDVIGVLDEFLTPPGEHEDPDLVALDFCNANVGLVGDLYDLYKGEPTVADQPGNAIVPARQTHTLAGYHVELQQYYQGVPLLDGTAVVHMTEQRQVYFFTNDLSKNLPEMDVTDLQEKGLSEQDALDVVGERLPLERLQARRIQHIVIKEGVGWRMAWQVDVALDSAAEIHNESERSGDWRALVDAETGTLIELLNMTMEAGGEGRIFYPNPIIALGQGNIAANATIPQDAYRTERLQRLDYSGTLSGRYADTFLTPNRVHQQNRVFHYDRSHPGFEEVMAYYYVDKVIAWLRRLGWRNLFRYRGPIGINAHAPIGDKSKFRPSLWALYFGDGGVNDGEDASIILHELGHAIQDSQVPNWATAPRNYPVRAMGEGFADWLTAIYFAEERRGFHTGWLGDWDSRGYSPPRPYLRRVTEQKTMADWMDEEHKDGEIWSSALWKLYLEMGGNAGNRKTRKKARSTAVNLILQSHHYLSDGNRFTLTLDDGAKALLTADRFLSDNPTTPGPYHDLIREIFTDRGFSLPPP